MAKDIIIDDYGDLVFLNGDFKVGVSDEQHAILIINTNAGSWKQSPLVGVGIIKYSASSGTAQALKKEIIKQMQADGFVNIEVTLRGSDSDTYDYYINASRNE